MKPFICLFAALTLLSCTEKPDLTDNGSNQSTDEIYAEKDSWKLATKASDDIAFAKDIPWKEGEKVMVIRTDSEKTIDKWGRVDLDEITYMCTGSKAAGLKCTLVPETPLESGTYHADF